MKLIATKTTFGPDRTRYLLLGIRICRNEPAVYVCIWKWTFLVGVKLWK